MRFIPKILRWPFVIVLAGCAVWDICRGSHAVGYLMMAFAAFLAVTYYIEDQN